MDEEHQSVSQSIDVLLLGIRAYAAVGLPAIVVAYVTFSLGKIRSILGL